MVFVTTLLTPPFFKVLLPWYERELAGYSRPEWRGNGAARPER
jgi:hypothetical protein